MLMTENMLREKPNCSNEFIVEFSKMYPDWLIPDKINTKYHLSLLRTPLKKWYGWMVKEGVLRKRSLIRVDFSNWDLSNVDFECINLTGSNMKLSKLDNANFKGADLFGAKFHGANLSGACLDYSNLFIADFTDAIVEGTSTRGVNFDSVINFKRQENTNERKNKR